MVVEVELGGPRQKCRNVGKGLDEAVPGENGPVEGLSLSHRVAPVVGLGRGPAPLGKSRLLCLDEKGRPSSDFEYKDVTPMVKIDPQSDRTTFTEGKGKVQG